MALRALAVRGGFLGFWTRSAASTWFGTRAATSQPNTARGRDFCESGGDQHECSISETGSTDQRTIVLPMPKLSHSMVSGRIVKWGISEGGPFGMYDVLLTVETETLVEEAYRLDQFAGKVALLVESQEEGFVARLLAAEGEEVPVGKPIALLCEHAEDVPAVRESSGLIERVRDVYSDPSTPPLRILDWQSYLARGPPSSGCL